MKFVFQSGTALGTTDQTFAFAVGDWNGDGTLDLFAIKKSNTGTGSTEVHVLSGATGFKSFIVQTGTALPPTDHTFEFDVGDWNGDGKLDLFAIKKSNTGTSSTEVHVLSGATGFKSFIAQTGTALPPTDHTFELDVGDWNGDGKLDLFALKKSNTGTSSTEVHILSGAAGFKSFLAQTGTALPPTDQTFDLEVGDWNGDGKLDLIAVKRSNTGTASTEVHVLSGATAFKSFLVQTGTALAPTDQTFEFEAGDWDKDGKLELFAIKKSNTGTGSTEVHILH